MRVAHIAPAAIKEQERELALGRPQVNVWACMIMLAVTISIMAVTAVFVRAPSLHFVRACEGADGRSGYVTDGGEHGARPSGGTHQVAVRPSSSFVPRRIGLMTWRSTQMVWRHPPPSRLLCSRRRPRHALLHPVRAPPLLRDPAAASRARQGARNRPEHPVRVVLAPVPRSPRLVDGQANAYAFWCVAASRSV